MIKVGSIVRYSNAFCESIRANSDTADGIARVVDIIPSRRIGGSTIPARAHLHWETGERNTSLVKNLEAWRGVPSVSAKSEWGIE